MTEMINYLLSVRGDIFKLLPMKEDAESGRKNHLSEYLDALLVNMTGALSTYPALRKQKQYLYVINNLQFIRNNEVSFERWRKIVLGSGKDIEDLCFFIGGTKCAK
jgi:hypothetical protein